jgi:hypothetical protein
MAQFEITWQAPEFEYREKGVSWYWITIIAAACIIAFAVWERNYLFGFFIVVAEILVIMWGNTVPRPMVFSLSDTGLSIGAHKHYALKEFESWSADNAGVPEDADGAMAEIGFNFTAKFKVPLKILVPTETLEEIRKNLKPLLREVEHQMTLIEAIEKLMRF